MNFPALALALAFSTAEAAPASLTVWLPERGETATLSAAGLVGKTSGRVVLDRPEYDLPQESPVAGGFARLTQKSGRAPARLDVVQGGKVTASRAFPEAVYGVTVQGNQRGPCLSYSEGDTGVTRCFTLDLRNEWAKPSGAPFVGASGKSAYTTLTDWKLEKPVSDEVDVVRHDLGTGKDVTLSYRVPLAGQTLVLPAGMVDPLDRRATVRFAAELPNDRFLVCASTTIPKEACRLDIVDRDQKRLFSLQGNAYIWLPQPSADGQKLYFLGNTLQVWDAGTGKRLAAIRDPLWQKQGQVPLKAYLTVDGKQAAIVVAALKQGSPDYGYLTAYIYRLSDGRRVQSFALGR